MVIGPGVGRVSEQVLLSSFVLIWGVNFLFAEVALLEVVPVAFSAARFLAGAVTGLTILWFRSKVLSFRLDLSSREKYRLGIAILLGGVVAPWLGIVGLSITHAGRAAIWVATFPLISYLFGLRLKSEHVSSLTLMAIGTTGLGAVLLSLDAWNNGSGWGDILLFSSVVVSAAELHVLRPLVLKHPPVSIGMIRLIIGAALYGIVALPWLSNTDWDSLHVITWIAILGGGMIATGLGQWIRARAIRFLGPTVLSIHYLAIPVVALIGGAVILKNPTSHIEWIACGIILSGVALLRKRVDR